MNEDRFLQEIEKYTRLTRDKAFKVATAVLHELHDRLTPNKADHVAASCPAN